MLRGPRLGALALSALLAGGACPRANAEILVAVPGTTAGRYAAISAEIRKGVEEAAAKLNAAGGIDGETLTLAIDDDGCTQVSGEAAARALAARAPAIVIGHACASAAVAASAVYAAAGILYISPSVRHPALTDARANKTVFRLAGRDDKQGEAAARWLLANAPGKRVAIAHDRTAASRAFAETAEKTLAAAGITKVPVFPIVAGRRDYPEVTQRCVAEKTEAMIYAGYPDEGAIVLNGLRRAGLATAFLGGDSLGTGDFAATARRAGGLVRTLVAMDLGGTIRERAAAALTLWAEAVRRAGSREPAKVAAALRAGPNATSFGTISFDGNGDAQGASFAAAEARNDSWVASE